MAQAMCRLPLERIAKQSATNPPNKISTCQVEQSGSLLICPFPSSGSEATTSNQYDMLIKQAFLCLARKDGSSPQDILHYIRQKCGGDKNSIEKKIESSLCRMLKHGFVYLHNKSMQRFKLTSKGKCMNFKEKKKSKSVCRYPSRSKSRSRSRSERKRKNVCKYPAKKKRKSCSRRRTVNRRRSKSRSKSRCRSKSRSKSRRRSKSRKPKNVCRYPPKKKRC